MERMHVLEAERIAQDLMANAGADDWNRAFEIHSATNIVKCKWLDPYFGLFEVEGAEGMARVSDLPRGTFVYQPVQ